MSASFAAHGRAHQVLDRAATVGAANLDQRRPPGMELVTLDGIPIPTSTSTVNFCRRSRVAGIQSANGHLSAELGRALGQVSVTTKAGTNNYHGAVFEFLRNDALDARPYGFAGVRLKVAVQVEHSVHARRSSPARPWFNGTDKLFFMANYEGFRLRNQRETLYSVPTVAMRNGDLSGIATVLRDPLTGQPFPGNVIPRSRMDPISLAFLEYYPEPNQPTSSLANNYLGVNQNTTDKNQATTRIDFVESSRSTWYGRYSWTRESIFTEGFTSTAISSIRERIRPSSTMRAS